MSPMDLDEDERLKPWLTLDHVNPFALSYAIVVMIGRLGLNPTKRIEVKKLIYGLNLYHLTAKVLQDVVEKSGFFDFKDGTVGYDWVRFANIKPEENEVPEDCPKIARKLPEDCPTERARDLNATKVAIDIDVDVDKVVVDKEKEKKEKATARISQLVDEWVIDPREENMPEREDVRRWMTWLLNLREGQAPYLLSKKCAIPNIKERWYDLVVSFAEHLALNGGFKEIKNYTTAQKYMSRVFTTNGRDGKLDKNFPGVFIQNQMKEEEEAAHKAWIEKEKQRFPFEDYDPERGTRYVGNDLIPWDAPPRPDAVSTWDEEDRCWRSPAEVEERAQRSHARFLEMLKTYNESHGKPGGAELPG